MLAPTEPLAHELQELADDVIRTPGPARQLDVQRKKLMHDRMKLAVEPYDESERRSRLRRDRQFTELKPIHDSLSTRLDRVRLHLIKALVRLADNIHFSGTNNRDSHWV